MKTVLKDYLAIYQRFPTLQTWNKENRKKRHKMLMEWQNLNYIKMPDLYEIIDFVKCHPDLAYERFFFLKVLVPCINMDIKNGEINAIRFMFEYNIDKDYVELFCEASDFIYTPFDLANMVLKKEPENESVLRYQYKGMERYLSTSIHEIPSFVIDGMDAAESSAIPIMLEYLSEFENVCCKLGEEKTELISLCRKLYLAWADYLNDRSVYNCFKNYLDTHHITYKE